jgi:hypothetical protein
MHASHAKKKKKKEGEHGDLTGTHGRDAHQEPECTEDVHYDRVEPKHRGRGDQVDGARQWKRESWRKQQTEKKSTVVWRKQEGEWCKGVPCCHSEEADAQRQNPS